MRWDCKSGLALVPAAGWELVVFLEVLGYTATGSRNHVPFWTPGFSMSVVVGAETVALACVWLGGQLLPKAFWSLQRKRQPYDRDGCGGGKRQARQNPGQQSVLEPWVWRMGLRWIAPSPLVLHEVAEPIAVTAGKGERVDQCVTCGQTCGDPEEGRRFWTGGGVDDREDQRENAARRGTGEKWPEPGAGWKATGNSGGAAERQKDVQSSSEPQSVADSDVADLRSLSGGGEGVSALMKCRDENAGQREFRKLEAHVEHVGEKTTHQRTAPPLGASIAVVAIRWGLEGALLVPAVRLAIFR